MLPALKEGACIWKDRNINSEEFIKTIREDRHTLPFPKSF